MRRFQSSKKSNLGEVHNLCAPAPAIIEIFERSPVLRADAEQVDSEPHRCRGLRGQRGGNERKDLTPVHDQIFKPFRYARKSAPRSKRFSANSTVALRNPSLSPAS